MEHRLLAKLQSLDPDIQKELDEHTSITVEFEKVSYFQRLSPDFLNLIKRNTNLLGEADDYSQINYHQMTLMFTRSLSGNYFFHLETIARDDDLDTIYLNTGVFSSNQSPTQGFHRFLVALMLAAGKYSFKLRKHRLSNKLLRLK